MSYDGSGRWLNELCVCGHARKMHTGELGAGACGAIGAGEDGRERDRCSAFDGTGFTAADLAEAIDNEATANTDTKGTEDAD